MVINDRVDTKRHIVTEIRRLHIHQGNTVIVCEVLRCDLLNFDFEETNHGHVFRPGDLAEGGNAGGTFVAT